VVPLLIRFVVFGFESSQNEITGETGAVIGTSSIGRVTRKLLNDTVLTADMMIW
jgi:hypothetical protein